MSADKRQKKNEQSFWSMVFEWNEKASALFVVRYIHFD